MQLLIGISAANILSSSLVAFFATEQFLKPSWYAHRDFGHRNRSPRQGLTPAVIGEAQALWRVSDNDDGLGNPKDTFGFDYEDVEIPNLFVRKRNRFLRGWWIPSSKRRADKDACIVAVHGGGRDRRAWLRHTPIFIKNGCSVLMFDLEEHGISDGSQRGIGWCTYEPDNILAAVDYAKNTLKYKHIVVCGTSMGGAGSLVAAGLGFRHHRTKNLRYDNDPRQYIDGVIAENPFTTRRDLMQDVLKDKLNKKILGPFTFLLRPLQRLILKVGLWRMRDKHHANPLDAVKKIEVPTLIMHGTDDALIPFQHSEILYKAAKNVKTKDLWIVQGGQHTGLHNAAPDEYEARVLSIIDRIGKRVKSH